MSKRKQTRDASREDRITMDIVVDAHGPEERALSWYYYLENQIKFPFAATCTAKRPTSPLRPKEEVEVLGMPGEDVCEHEMFVTIRWERDGLAVPLSQLNPTSSTGEQTRQAIEDWLYWVSMATSSDRDK